MEREDDDSVSFEAVCFFPFVDRFMGVFATTSFDPFDESVCDKEANKAAPFSSTEAALVSTEARHKQTSIAVSPNNDALGETTT